MRVSIRPDTVTATLADRSSTIRQTSDSYALETPAQFFFFAGDSYVSFPKRDLSLDLQSEVRRIASGWRQAIPAARSSRKPSPIARLAIAGILVVLIVPVMQIQKPKAAPSLSATSIWMRSHSIVLDERSAPVQREYYLNRTRNGRPEECVSGRITLPEVWGDFFVCRMAPGFRDWTAAEELALFKEGWPDRPQPTGDVTAQRLQDGSIFLNWDDRSNPAKPVRCGLLRAYQDQVSPPI